MGPNDASSSSSYRYLLLLVWLSLSFISALLLFCRGLLLHKDVLPQRTSCVTDIPDRCYNYFEKKFNLICLKNLNNNIEQQFCTESNSKVVLIIIDALRFDFAEFDATLGSQLPYRNKLPIFHHLLKTRENNARLHKFIADPPTTTMQRISGLTTGSLPTFIDIGSNFATSEINEDNIINALQSEKKKIVFMGDDTWDKLYPNKFLRNYPFDSFNVWDLDTVDRGVMSNLYPELEKSDWNLLIAHFLGVDHCGHRYGPDHPEMERKLTEMDLMLRKVVEILNKKNDTMLFVVGDHGMTSTGDHGGETSNEITSALFVYSPTTVLLGGNGSETHSVRQVDLVPTLCSILGISIPFSNTGSLLTDCLPKSIVGSAADLIFQIWRNVEQITTYIKEYSSKNSQFSEYRIHTILKQYDLLQTELTTFDKFNINIYTEKYKLYMKSVVEMCIEVWIQFDSFSIIVGLILLLIMCVLLILVLNVLSLDNFRLIFNLCYTLFCFFIPFLLFCIAAVLYINDYPSHVELILFSIGVFSALQLIGISLKFRLDIWYQLLQIPFKINLASFFIYIGYLSSVLSLFSNSYIIQEPSVIYFLLVSVLYILTKDFYARKSVIKPVKTKFNNIKRSKFDFFQDKITINVIIVSIIFRLCLIFLRCRDEHGACTESKIIHTPKICFIVIVLLNMYITVFRKVLQYNGNSLGSISNTIICSSIPKLSGLLIPVYWIYEVYFSNNSKQRYLFIDKIPVFLLISCILSVIYLLYDSLCVHQENSPFEKSSENGIISYFLRYVKDQVAFNQLFGNIRGITTIYSALFANISIFLCIICSMVSTQIYAFPVILMIFTTWYLAFILSTQRSNGLFNISEMCDVPWIYIILWGLSSVYWFYTTGHNTSFSGIQWNAAFLITKEINNNMFVPAILVLANTFVSYILHSALIPILLIFPFTLNSLQPRLFPVQNRNEVLAYSNELSLVHNDEMFYHAAFKLVVKYLLFFVIRGWTCNMEDSL